jgi:uncharacterized protein (TIGR00266 family)
MEVALKHQPSATLAVVTLAGNEVFDVESGAMVSYSDGVTIQTEAKGGLMGGLKRALGGESFFHNLYTAPAQGGEVTLAHNLVGDMQVVNVGPGEFRLRSGAYIASEHNVTLDTKWGGAKGFFSGSGLILLSVGGNGKVIVGCYGAMEERILQPGQRYTVDTGHVVGFDAGIQFSVKRVGGWKSTILSGEGLVCELVGPGRVLMQTRSEDAFLGWLLPKIPKSSN